MKLRRRETRRKRERTNRRTNVERLLINDAERQGCKGCHEKDGKGCTRQIRVESAMVQGNTDMHERERERVREIGEQARGKEVG